MQVYMQYNAIILIFLQLYKKSLNFFCKIQSLFKNKQKNINHRNIPRLHQRPFAIFRVACEFLDDRSSPNL